MHMEQGFDMNRHHTEPKSRTHSDWMVCVFLAFDWLIFLSFDFCVFRLIGTECTEEELKHIVESDTPGMESPTRAKTRTRSQILGELLRVKKEMVRGPSIVGKSPTV